MRTTPASNSAFASGESISDSTVCIGTGVSHSSTWASKTPDDLVHHTFDLFVMNADGGGQPNLTHTPGVSELGASWAPS